MPIAFIVAFTLLPILFGGCGKPHRAVHSKTHFSPLQVLDFQEAGSNSPTPRPFSFCLEGITSLAEWNALGQGTLEPWLTQNRVVRITQNIEQKYVIQFAFEFLKFPESLRREINLAQGRFHILQGRGVSEDPSWSSTRPLSFDGRSWNTVSATGGMPYLNIPMRVVVNRLYVNYQAANVVLHELAHTLDSTHSLRRISGSAPWERLWQENPRFIRLMNDHCGSYCANHPSEAFAETMALFYSCAANQQFISTRFPTIASFITNLSAQGSLAFH